MNLNKTLIKVSQVLVVCAVFGFFIQEVKADAAWSTSFSDNFQRADGPVGNSWIDTSGAGNIISNILNITSSADAPWVNNIILRPSGEDKLDQRLVVTFPAVPSNDLWFSLRRQSNGDQYVVSPNVGAGGGRLDFLNISGGGTALSRHTPMVPYTAPADQSHILQLDVTVIGTNPTKLSAKVTDLNTSAVLGTSTYTDSQASLQMPGSLGVFSYPEPDVATNTINSFTSYNCATGACAYSASGPSSAQIDTASSNFSVKPDNDYTGTITPTDNGAGGVFTPTSVTYSNASSTQTFTYTPSSVGTKTISFSSSPGLEDPDSIIMNVTSPTLGVVAVNDSHLVWSPYTWSFDGANSAQTTPGGAYLKLAFSGSTLALGVDTTNTDVASTTTHLHAYIDGSTTPIDVTLSQATSSLLVFATSTISTGNHYAEIYVSRTAGVNERWNNPVETVKITKIQLANDGTGNILPLSNTPLAQKNRKILVFGDSITEGFGTAQDESSYAAILGNQLGVEYGQVGYGYLGWSHAGQGGAGTPYFYDTSATSTSLWRNYYLNTPRILDNSNLSSGFIDGVPNAVYVNLGINDANTSVPTSEVRTKTFDWISDVRQTIGSWPAIFVVSPFNFGSTTNATYQTYKTALVNGLSDYTNVNPSDSRVYLLDLGVSGYNTVHANSSDDLHPNEAGALILGNDLAATSSPYITDLPVVVQNTSYPNSTTGSGSSGYIAGHAPQTPILSPTICPTGALFDSTSGAPCPSNSKFFASTSIIVFTKSLTLGNRNIEVQSLQHYLNTHGFSVSKSGAGSLGSETTFFGSATKAALIKFQKANNISPAIGYFGPITRGYISTH